MKFTLQPILDRMLELYESPRGIDRFREYLALLQGDTNADLAIPISGYNPMAKEHVTKCLLGFKELGAEGVAEETMMDLNTRYSDDLGDLEIKVFLNVMDDDMGGWTNGYTSDFDSKFKINALAERHFCVPVLWTSKTYTAADIQRIVAEYAHRTVYWFRHGRLRTLADHVRQEQYVSQQMERDDPLCTSSEHSSFLASHAESDEYPLIFNFFYGDGASRSLGYKEYGLSRLFA